MRIARALPWAFLAVLSALPSPARAARTVESRPADAPITLDGAPSDWDGIPLVPLEAGLHWVAVAHDRDNLYLMYRFADERLARELLARGVLLWMSGDGQTKRTDEAYGIRYAGSSGIARYLATVAEQSGGERSAGAPPALRPPLDAGRPGSPRIHPDEITRVRFGVKDAVEQGPESEPAAASAAIDGSFCYELRIPIADIGGKAAGRPPSKARRIAIGIQIGGLTDAERELIEGSRRSSMRAPGGAPPGFGTGGHGGMGGPGGGGPLGGSRPGGGPGDMDRRLDPKIEWLEVVLEPISVRAR